MPLNTLNRRFNLAMSALSQVPTAQKAIAYSSEIKLIRDLFTD
ncbi:hypothetical protein [Deefgea rivuli]|nr:hypothetical protein [Deefgea rivuli]